VTRKVEKRLVFEIPVGRACAYFVLGVREAKAVLENLDAIRKFVEENEETVQRDKTPGKEYIPS